MGVLGAPYWPYQDDFEEGAWEDIHRPYWLADFCY